MYDLGKTEEAILASKFKVFRRINSGSFGDICYAINMKTGEEVAIKMERVTVEHPQLPYESRVYKILQGRVGIPRFHWYGTENGANALVIELMGPSLENLFDYCGRRFTMKTVLMLADQMLDRIQTLHDNHFVHRDIKPDNFLMGLGTRCSNLYIVDFGMAKKYRDFITQEHMPYKEGKQLNGTARYASINTHLGYEQSRRDDMEAIGLVLMYFILGVLPWQCIKASTKKAKYEKVKEKKMTTSVEELCHTFPPEFAVYLNYTRNLKFDETPDYMYLRRLFRNVFRQFNLQFDHSYDWVVLGQLNAQSMVQPDDYDFRPARRAF